MIGAIVLAAGQGKRMQAGMNKQYLTIEGRSVLSLAIESMAQLADALIVVSARGEEAQAWKAVAESGVERGRVQVVEGGRERQDSVRHALLAMPADWEKVLIHDGARPFVSKALLRRVLDATESGVGVVPGLAVTDTIKRIDAEGFVVETPERACLRAVQTPQGFMAQEILVLHQALAESGLRFTDDAALYEASGKRVRVVQGDVMTNKLTVPSDLLWAAEMKHQWETLKNTLEE